MTNNNLSVLLTRPLEKSRQLADHIQDVVANVEICPLFTYSSGHQQHLLAEQLTSNQIDIVIFVSPAAVSFANQIIPLKTLADIKSVIAVGDATLKLLHDFGVSQAVSPTLQKSEGVLELLQTTDIKDKNIIIVRGNGGREMMKKQLELKGAKVAYNEVYTRNWISLDKQQAFEKWRKDQINCIVVTSSELLQKLLSYIDDKHWAKQCTWIVVSERTAQQAKSAGLLNVVNSEGASHQDIRNALIALNRA